MRFEGFTAVTEMYIIMNVIPCGMDTMWYHVVWKEFTDILE